MENRFKIQLKDGDSTQALAFLVTYNKAFGKSHRFIWSTGIEVRRAGFDPAKPGRALDNRKRMAEDAYQSLLDDGQPLTAASLKHRIELYRDRTVWVDNQLSTWDGKKIRTYVIPNGVDRNALRATLSEELLKQAPNLHRVVTEALGSGSHELFGFWRGILSGTIKPRHGKTLRKSSMKVKEYTMKLVQAFDPAASFDKMDMGFYNAFTRWLSEVKKYDPNTVGRHIRQLKAVLHLAYRNERITNDRFKYWSVVQERNEVITLNREELLKLINHELTGIENDLRDAFVLACFLGPRISDFKSFNSQSLTNEAGILFFQYVQEKTGAICKVPVHPIAQKILDKRNGQFPRMISEQNFRYRLHAICEDAGIDTRVVVKIRDGVPSYKKKHEAITPHSARRTFASNLFYGWFSRPLPASLCMRFTGHKSEKSFMLYIGATDEELNKMALSYFDLQPQMKVG